MGGGAGRLEQGAPEALAGWTGGGGTELSKAAEAGGHWDSPATEWKRGFSWGTSVSQFRLWPTHCSLHFPGSLSQRGGTVTLTKVGGLEHLIEAAARVGLPGEKESWQGEWQTNQSKPRAVYTCRALSL